VAQTTGNVTFGPFPAHCGVCIRSGLAWIEALQAENIVQGQSFRSPCRYRSQFRLSRQKSRLNSTSRFPESPNLNGEIRWEATAEAFTENPFLLTMKAEAARIQGLNVAPCSPVRKKQ
jgi:hypothetical protein